MAPTESSQMPFNIIRKGPEVKPQDLEACVEKTQSSTSKQSLHESPWTLLKIWRMELLSWCLSAVALALLVSVLYAFNGKDPSKIRILNHTGSSGLNLNTIVSILAITIRAALIYPVAESISQLKCVWFNDSGRKLEDFESYDEASRGPWGSFKMLFSPALWRFVAVGLIITITSIAAGPFIQQIITYTLLVSPLHSSADLALIPRADYYAASQNTLGTSSNYNAIKSDLKGAVYSGIYESTNISAPAKSSIQPTCTTGKCTWPPYTSLAVCSKCQNISSLLNDISNSNWMHSSGYRTDGKYAMNITTNASPIAYPNLQNPIINLKSAVFRPGFYDNPYRPNVTECALWFCVNTYEGIVKNGNFMENITRTWPTANDTRDMTQSTILPPVNPDGSSSLTVYKMNGTADNLQPPYLKEQFLIDMDTLHLLRDWIGGLFQKSKDADGDRDGGKGEGLDMTQALYEIQIESTTGITNIVQSIATKMTDVIRNQQGAAGQYTTRETRAPGILTTQANDTTESMVVSVKVDWIWLSFPIVLVTASLLFLIATIVITSSKEIPSWKSSNLAVLGMGLDEGDRRDFTRDGISLPTLDRKAKDFEVRSGRRDEEMRLVGRDKHQM